MSVDHMHARGGQKWKSNTLEWLLVVMRGHVGAEN